MLNQIDLTHDIPKILQALYWIVVDISNTLEEGKCKANRGLRLHLMLASKRFNIIIEHLKIALEEAGIELDERLEEEEIRKRIGTLSINTLEDVKKTIKKIINESVSNNECKASWLSSKLIEFADVISIACCLLKMYLESLRGSTNEYTWRICLILQIVVHDLEIIENTHRYLASNLEMLIKNLKS